MLHRDHLVIHQRETEGVVILDLKGNLLLGASDGALRDSVLSLFEAGNRQLALNLAGVSEIDTAGCGALLALAQQYAMAGGKLVLVQLAHVHEELYEMARLESNLEIYDLELDAVNSYFPERVVKHYDILDYIDHRNDPKKSP
jgi:anti-sigma B factor antagonist